MVVYSSLAQYLPVVKTEATVVCCSLFISIEGDPESEWYYLTENTE